MASTSTDTPRGKLLTLTAALVCIPASPNTFAIVSDAPLITLGWSVKISVEFTYPVNLIQDLIFDKSPFVAFFDWETILFRKFFLNSKVVLSKMISMFKIQLIILELNEDVSQIFLLYFEFFNKLLYLQGVFLII